MDLALGRVVGGYRLDQELGRGAMGVVFRARDLALRKDVALKILLPRVGAPDLVRWRIEGWAAGRLEHPHIARVLAGGVDQGVHYLAMELYGGGSLAEEIDRGRVTPARAATVALQLARALAHAHERGVLHRDVKPGNILLDPARERAYLADFGLARILDDALRCTTPGDVLGTLCYMSPEQLEGRDAIGPASDIYAAGVVLYELATGRLPYHSPRLAALARAVLDGRLTPPRTVDPRVPRELDAICQRALARDPARRYASSHALADDLARFLAGEPVTARSPGSLERASRWAGRHRRVLATVLATALATSAFAWGAHARDRAARDAAVLRDREWLDSAALADVDPQAALAHLDRTPTPHGREADADRARARAWLVLGDTRLAHGDCAGARAAVDRATAHGADPGAVRLARLELAEGRPASALARLEGSASGLALAPDALVVLVEAALAAARPDVARSAVDALKGRAPRTAGVALLDARVFHAQGRNADATVALSIALAERPRDAAALALRAAVRLALHDGDAALADLELLASWGEPVSRETRAKALLWCGRPDAEAARAAGDLHTAALAAICAGAMSTDRAELAALSANEQARAAAVLDPARTPAPDLTTLPGATPAPGREPTCNARPPSTLVTRARARLAKGDLDRALALARLAALVEPCTGESFVLLAQHDRLRGRIGPARARYAQALQIDPHHAAARLAGARLALDASDAAGALALADAHPARAAGPARAALERLAAEAWLALGNAGAARARLAPLLALDALDGEAARLDAVALTRLGRTEEARAARAALAVRARTAEDRRGAIRREARQAARDGNFGRAIERASELVTGECSSDEAEALYLRATCRLRAMHATLLAPALADLVRALELDARLRLQVDGALARLVAFVPRDVVLGAAAAIAASASGAGTTGADAHALTAELHRALARCSTAHADDLRWAREGYERALALAPTHRLARWGRARFLIETGELEAAARDLEQLDQDGPPSWDAALLRAELAGRSGDVAAQERHLADARASGLPTEPDASDETGR